MANLRPLDSYPMSWGASKASVFPHAGPSNYVQITFGPVANGDTVQAVEGGAKSFDFLVGGVTDSGSFFVQAIPTASSVGPTGQQSITYRLRWVALRTASIGGQAQTVNTEAVASTDLSAETVRLLGIFNK